jgi:RNA polymerase sigma-70 factor (ECF subfamily)
MQATTDRLLEQMYLAHGQNLVHHLAFVTRDRELAEDLAHDAFVRLAREIEAGRSPDNPRAWLHRVGRNLATSRARHMQVEVRRDAELRPYGQPPDPESIAVEHELTDAVRTAMTDLSAAERRALLLAAYGVSGSEIAATLERTPGATRTLLCRARAKIRERMTVMGYASA